MVEASGAMIQLHKYLVPTVHLAFLRKGVGEVFLWFKAAQDQEIKEGVVPSLFPTGMKSCNCLGRQGSPWEIPRSVVLEIGSLISFAEKRKRKRKVREHHYKGKIYFQHNFKIDLVSAASSSTIMEKVWGSTHS